MELALWAAVKAGNCTQICLGASPPPTCPAPNAAPSTNLSAGSARSVKPPAGSPDSPPSTPAFFSAAVLLPAARLDGRAGSSLGGGGAAVGLTPSVYLGGFGRYHGGYGRYGGDAPGSYGVYGGATPPTAPLPGALSASVAVARLPSGPGGYFVRPDAGGSSGPTPTKQGSNHAQALAAAAAPPHSTRPAADDYHAHFFGLADFALAVERVPAPAPAEQALLRGAQRLPWSALEATAQGKIQGDGGQYVLTVGQAGDCSAPCGGGMAVAPITCADRARGVPAPLSACRHRLSDLAALAAPCNSLRCTLLAC